MRVVDWFARNSVASNILMILIIAGGIISVYFEIKQEVFPEFTTDRITVTVEYLGATPAEVEESVCVRVEEAIEGVEGIKKITSTASENVGVVTVEVVPDYGVRRVLDDIKTRVDAIDTFPVETEKPIVQELVVRHQVINVAISGEADERSLKALGERVRDDLAATPGITQVDLINTRPYEISIEVSEGNLRRYGITFDDVARAVRRSSLDLPGGSIKTSGGEILLRTKGQAYRQADFDDITILTRADGTRLSLRDVATVVDGFADTDQYARFNGRPSAMVQVYRVGDQNALDIAEEVRSYVASAASSFPEGIEVRTWQDASVYLTGRIDLLMRNAKQGFILVFIVLALFLRLRLAIWVSLGVPLSFLGTLWLFPTLDVSVNLLSLFAFILVLGIVVDDAIIVGESIFTLQERRRRENGGRLSASDAVGAAIAGTRRVAVPVFFAIFTTVAAFSPMLVVSGQMGKVLRVISLIVIPTLAFSLLESMLILPSHLSHFTEWSLGRVLAPIAWIQDLVAKTLRAFLDRVYRPTLDFCLRWRYLTLALGLGTLVMTAGLVEGGWIKFVFFPTVPDDNVAATLTMPLGTPVETTEAAIRRIERAAVEVQNSYEREHGEKVFRHILASIGDQPRLRIQRQSAGRISMENFSGSHLGEVHIELVPTESRTISSPEIERRWREAVGTIPDAVELTFSSSIFNAGAAINVQMSGLSEDGLHDAATELREYLATLDGVYDITDSFREGKREVVLDILPSAEQLGLTRADLGTQVRQAFYGEEAQRVQRGRDDVRVMVRYPASERCHLGNLEEMRIRTARGEEVPFSSVARMELGRGFANIQRVDRNRVINVTAEVDTSKTTSNIVMGELRTKFLPELRTRYHRLRYTFEGEQREQAESLDDMIRGFLVAVLAIYGLLAIPFRSYLQPFIIVSAIPFGVVGAVWGHAILGLNLNILSVFGLVALTGVVVNDSLVLVDYINNSRAEGGRSVLEIVRESGVARFRAILLTSLTTFAGLTPLMLFEKSVQAKFLVPMAASLAFGVMFSTVVTLVLIPAAYLILEDVKRAFKWLWACFTRAAGLS